MLLILVSAICLIFSPAILNAQTVTLGTYNIDKSKITVSGVSSGAAMATQLHVAYSSIIIGSGSIAGPPYYCSSGSVLQSTTSCMLYSYPISMTTIYSQVASYSSQGLIDNPNNLGNQRVYLFSGLLDVVVNSFVVKKNEEFFQNYMGKSNIKSVYTLSAVHGHVTDNYGYACAILSPFYLNNCLYNQAFDILSHLLPNDNLVRPSSLARPTGTYIQFNQKEFFPSGTTSRISMEDYGFLYVPTVCQTQQCKLHIALHGCLMAARNIGDIYIRNAGYNTIADANRFIILYPQADSNAYNTNACWDWWGYTSSDFANQNGYQMRAIRDMIARLASI